LIDSAPDGLTCGVISLTAASERCQRGVRVLCAPPATLVVVFRKEL
jgi:hypothetical protein